MLILSMRSIVMLLGIVLAGCAGGAGQFGTAEKAIAVDRIFRSGPVPAEYRYYYNGVKGEPTAILGLSKEYVLQSEFWTEINLDDHQMSEWRKFFLRSITWYDDRSHGRMSFDGYRLSDPSGKEIGILYSRYDWIVLEFLPDSRIIVHPPQPRVIHHDLWEDIPVRH